MIPTESLAVEPTLRLIGLSLLVLFVFSILLILGGSSVFHYLQRKALERSLNKIKWHKLVAAILLSFSLLTSQMAVGQTAPAPKTSSAARYQKLFALVSGLSAQTKKVCKTEACTKASDELAVVIADGQDKHSNGLLVGETRKQFHTDLDACSNYGQR
jgi:hypothetical protein